MKNLKKIVALILAVMMLAGLVASFTSCGKVTAEDPGATINLYMPYVVSLDPAVAYQDEASAKLLSLVYQGLTSINKKGKLVGELADSWEVYTDRDGNKVLDIHLKTTRWSDGTTVDAEDFVDSWERILDPAFNCQAASLLFPVQNAAAVKRGDMTLSDLGLRASTQDTLTVLLEDWADPETFLRNCASVALYPVRKDVINKIYDRDNQKENDWSTLIAIMVSNGPFFLKTVSFGTVAEGDVSRPYMILERNTNYYLDPEKNESLDKYVVPYRLHINMTYGNDAFWPTVETAYTVMATANKINSTVEEIKAGMTQAEINALGDDADALLTEMAKKKIKNDIAISRSEAYIDTLLTAIRENKADFAAYYESGKTLYNASLPLDTDTEDVETVNTMFTGAFYFNTENAVLSDVKVRTALSMALDREYIASLVKYATAADTLVTDGVFETVRKTSFKANADYGVSTTADLAGAQSLLSQAGVSGGEFTISVRACETDVLIARYAQEVWKELGFDVHILIYGYDVVTYNEDVLTKLDDGTYAWVSQIIYDGLLHDKFNDVYTSGDYDVLFYDVNMLTTDAFPVLAQYASIFSGSAYDFSDPANFDVTVPHNTGYMNEAYDSLLEAAMVATDAATRAALLHEAEALLLQDLPITPVIYYQNAYTLSGELDDVELNYFGAPIFTETSYDNYRSNTEEVTGETEADTESEASEASED